MKEAISSWLESRFVAFITPWVVALITWASHYIDTSKWDAPTISTFIVASVASGYTLAMANKRKSTEAGVKQIQESINGANVPQNVTVDGSAVPNGQTVTSVRAILNAAGKGH